MKILMKGDRRRVRDLSFQDVLALAKEKHEAFKQKYFAVEE